MHSGTKQIAKQRIRILFEQAQATIKTDPMLSSGYVGKARKIAMAARVRLPKEFKRCTCKGCDSFFVHGENCRVRVRQKRESHVVITCLNCGRQTRILLRKTRKETEYE